MRVLFCKLHCPLICFCKPSSTHLLSSPCPLKLENTPNVPSSVSSVPDELDQVSMEEKVDDGDEKVSSDGKQEDGEDEEVIEILPKSSLKKSSSVQLGKEVEKGKVQWMDFYGKELVEIREFEVSESEDSDDESEGVRGCACAIQ